MCCYSVFQALLERTGYTLDVTTGQRKYGGPPPEDVFKGTQPGIGTEVDTMTDEQGNAVTVYIKYYEESIEKYSHICLSDFFSSSGFCWENPQRFV